VVHPISLEDMLGAARRDGYTAAGEVQGDMALMVRNAETYNGADSPVVHQAQAVSRAFEASLNGNVQR
jgi:hypothetical protein